METTYFLGIDVAKKTLQAALTVDGRAMVDYQLENGKKGIKSFFKDLFKQGGFASGQLVVCIEHTGIYCNHLLDVLVEMKIKLCVESALQIKRSQGLKRGKTDKVDARRIAQYLYKNKNEINLWQPPRREVQALKQLLKLRERLIRMKNQLAVPLREGRQYIEETVFKEIMRSCKSSIKVLEQDILRVEKQIREIVSKDPAIQHQMRICTSITGIGNITALHVIITSGEFQLITDPKKYACYTGVAPFEHTSGTSVRGKTRVSKMANMGVKRLLHLAAMSARQHNAELRHYYERKIAQGKNKMSVLNAVRNKLITRIFSCVLNDRMYQKNYQPMLV